MSLLFRCAKQNKFISWELKFLSVCIFSEFYIILANYLLPGSRSGGPKWNGSETLIIQEESPEGGRFKKEVVVDGQSYLLLIRDEGGPPEIQVRN